MLGLSFRALNRRNLPRWATPGRADGRTRGDVRCECIHSFPVGLTSASRLGVRFLEPELFCFVGSRWQSRSHLPRSPPPARVAMHLSSYLPAALVQQEQINVDDDVLQQALVLVVAAPLIWNIVARTIRSARHQRQRDRRDPARAGAQWTRGGTVLPRWHLQVRLAIGSLPVALSFCLTHSPSLLSVSLLASLCLSVWSSRRARA